MTTDMPPETFRGRVALVTGGSGGIGQAIALALAAEGAPVAVHYSRQREAAEKLAARITGQGGRAVALGADLSSATAPGELVTATEQALGPIGLLVSNAGRGQRRTLEELTTAEFDQTLAINLRAPFLLAQRVLPRMKERGFGRSLFVSSVAGFTGGIIGPHYGSSKAGLHGLIHFLAAQFAAGGITVNGLAPALIADTAMLPGDPSELARRVPVGRLGRPAEVADLALSVLGNGYLTNQVISIDGGTYPH
ncbi:MAG TPA: SDR family NAD(P)-dependent oxidoreductase [Streptosporangiaceae bacterium]|nr:SDR family NAD(P)-dependent oxidoreductase [Streptosporangiaceae bacterium]